MPPVSRTVDLLPLTRAAAVAPSTINDESRTVELTWSTGAPVKRFDWWTGKSYIEKLSMKPEHIRLDRLNGGAPLLNSHSSYSLSDQIGVVEDGTAKVVGKKAIATVRFSRRDDVEPIWTDVKDRVIRNVSVGYIVHKFEEKTDGDGGIPIRTAVDWEPYEISMVPMPADAAAQTRNGKKPEASGTTHPCEIVTRGAEPTDDPTESNEETHMADAQQSETIVERNPLDPDPAEPRLKVEPTEPNDLDRGADVERERISGIMTACEAARMTRDFMRKLIDEKTPLVVAQTRIFDEMKKRGGDAKAGPQPPPSDGGRVAFGDDPFVHERKGIENALCHRVAPNTFKLEPQGFKYRGLTLLETARIFLQARGVRVTELSKNQIAALALGLDHRTGYHTTSDFSLLLADVASKTLRQEYAAAPQTFLPIARRVTLPDYRVSNRLQIGEAPALLEVKEHGEYTHGTIGEGREQMQLVKYGRKFAITREAIVNDDTDAFSRVPAKFGRAARNLESNIVWLQILSNPLMGDSNALFSAAHNNLAATGDPISIETIGVGRSAMRLQTSLDSDGQTFIDATPRFLIVPPSLETKADQFVSTNLMANLIGQVNPFGGRLTVISEPRLETGIGTQAGSAIAWYLAASSEQGVDLLEYGYLDGEEGPVVESRVGFDIDGLEIKCRLDFAAKVIDWKGFYKNPGALES